MDRDKRKKIKRSASKIEQLLTYYRIISSRLADGVVCPGDNNLGKK